MPLEKVSSVSAYDRNTQLLSLKLIKSPKGWLHYFLAMYLNKNTVIVTICVAVIHFPGLFLEMEQNFMEQKVNTAPSMKIPIKGFFSKWDHIYSFLRIWSHSQKKILMENFIFLCSDR